MEKSDLDIARRYVSLADSAKTRGIECTIPFSEFKKIFNSKRCYYSGIKLSHGNNFSLDRLDNNKGYVSGNVVPCEKSLNERKGNLSINDIQMIMRGITKKLTL